MTQLHNSLPGLVTNSYRCGKIKAILGARIQADRFVRSPEKAEPSLGE
jgi:hypothetical protein